MQTFSTPGQVHLHVNNPVGTIRVVAGDRETTTVELDGSGLEHVRVEHAERGDEHDIFIEVPTRMRFRFLALSTNDVDVKVAVPTGTTVKATGVAADVNVRGAVGEVEVRSVSGDIEVEACAGGKVTSISGDVNVGRFDGDGSAQNVSGDVRIRSLDGDLNCRTVSGSIHFDCVGRGEVSIRSVSGDVTVGIKRGSGVFVDAGAVSGDLSSDLDLTSSRDDVPAADLVDLRVQTMSGDVRLRRANESAAHR